LLRVCSGERVPWATCVAIHCRTQLLKYLPSNALHLVGRHAMARRLGADHVALLWSAVAETALIALSAVALALVLGFGFFREGGLHSSSPNPWLLAGLVLPLFLGATFLFLRFRRRAGVLVSLPRATLAATLAVLVYVVFF